MRLILIGCGFVIAAVGLTSAQGNREKNSTSPGMSNSVPQLRLRQTQAPDGGIGIHGVTRWLVFGKDRKVNSRNGRVFEGKVFENTDLCFNIHSYIYDSSSPPRPTGDRTCTDAKLSRLQPTRRSPDEVPATPQNK